MLLSSSPRLPSLPSISCHCHPSLSSISCYCPPVLVFHLCLLSHATVLQSSSSISAFYLMPLSSSPRLPSLPSISCYCPPVLVFHLCLLAHANVLLSSSSISAFYLMLLSSISAFYLRLLSSSPRLPSLPSISGYCPPVLVFHLCLLTHATVLQSSSSISAFYLMLLSSISAFYLMLLSSSPRLPYLPSISCYCHPSSVKSRERLSIYVVAIVTIALT